MIEINGTLIAQILNFLILVGILRAVAYKPVVNIIKARQDKIQESIDKAEADAVAADKMLADYKAKLAVANAKAEEIISAAEKRANEDREAQRAETRREIENMKKAAEAEIARERERAAEHIREEVVKLSLIAASKVISKNIEKADNEQLVDEFVSKLDKDKIGELPC